MRNLKRTLSLVLAAAMLISMMVIGAGAVSYDDFPDRDEIVNKDAVTMLTTLGLIEGTDQGTFDPTGNVDRAQMAKMIAVMLSNNENCDTLYMTVNSGLTDIASNWARGYINYCYTLGIIAGRGDNTFDPGSNVTAVEAAKMLLTALGYDADIEGLVGPDWALNTAAMAHQLGIFRNFTKDVNEPLNRDDAALLIYNAMDVEMIQQYSNGYALVYSDNRTILSSVFGVMRMEGVVVGNEWARLEGTNSAAALREGKTNLENVVRYDSTTANTVVDEGIRVDGTVQINVSTPVDYLGKAVTVYVEKTTVLSSATVIGIALNDELNSVVAASANEDEAADYLDGTGIEVDRDTQYYVNYGAMSAADAQAWLNNYEYQASGTRFNLNGIRTEVIDNDDDGDAEYVLYLQETLSEVQRYNDRAETITFYAPNRDSNDELQSTATPIAVDFADVVFEDEVATDDVILYVQYGGRTYIKLADYVTGTMARIDRDRDNEQYVTLDSGEEYRQSYILDAATPVDVDLTRFHIATAREDIGFDTEYDFFLDSTGQYIIAARPAEETIANYALVLESAWTLNALDRSGQVKILMADGTEGTYTIDWDESRDAMSGVGFAEEGSSGDPDYKALLAPTANTNNDLDRKLERYLGTRDVNQENSGTYNEVNAAAGSIITYSLNSAGDRLTIESVLQGNVFEPDVTATHADPGNNTTLEIDDSVNTSTTAGVGDNGSIVYVGDKQNFQYSALGGYTNGSGTITVNGRDEDATLATGYAFDANGDITGTAATLEDRSGDRRNYAVDLDTVAFYYDDSNPADVKYGVAVGWDDMGTVEGVEVQVYPVLDKTSYRTYKASNLADVILFDCAPVTDSSDYMLVLSANAQGRDLLELNVVFEDGTAATIEIDDKGAFDEDVNSYFMKAWSYTQNADGTYDIGDMGKTAGVADLLINRTVDFRDLDSTTENGIGPISENTTSTGGTADSTPAENYISLSGTANVWDVTDVDNAEDVVSAGTFRVGVDVYTVLVLNNDGSIRTAWIWDIPGQRPVDPVTPELEVYIYDTEGDPNFGHFQFRNAAGHRLTELEAALRAEFDRMGYEINSINLTSASVGSASVTFKGTSTTTTFTAMAMITSEVPGMSVTATTQEIKPVAMDVVDSSGNMDDLFSSLAGVGTIPGKKMTAMSVELQLPSNGTTYYAVRQVNSALESCATPIVTSNPTAVLENGQYVKASSFPTSGNTFSMAVQVVDDGAPIVLEIYSSSDQFYDKADLTAASASVASSADWGDLYTSNDGSSFSPFSYGTPAYVITIDTTGISFQ